jgi:hypothetical protein
VSSAETRSRLFLGVKITVILTRNNILVWAAEKELGVGILKGNKTVWVI